MSIFLKDEKGFTRIKVNQIISVEVVNRRCNIFIEGIPNPLIINKPLSAILKLDPEGLSNVGRDRLIRIDKIEKLNKDCTNIVLAGGLEVKVSRRNSKIIRGIISNNSL